MLRLLLYAQAVAFFVEFCNTIALGVVDIVAKDSSEAVLLCIFNTLAKQTAET